MLCFFCFGMEALFSKARFEPGQEPPIVTKGVFNWNQLWIAGPSTGWSDTPSAFSFPALGGFCLEDSGTAGPVGEESGATEGSWSGTEIAIEVATPGTAGPTGIRNHRKFLEWYRNSYRSSRSGRIFYWRFCRWSQLISNKPLSRPIWPTIALLIITTWFPIWNKATYKGTFYVEVFVEDRCHIPGVYVVSTSRGLSQGNLKPRHDVSSSYITCIYTLINSG